MRTVSWPRRPCFRSRFDLFRHDKSCESYERSLRQSFGLQEGNVLGCWSTQKGYSFAKSTRLMLEARLTFTPSKRVASKTLPPDPSTSNWAVVKTSNVIHVSLSQRVSIFYCEVEQKRENAVEHTADIFLNQMARQFATKTPWVPRVEVNARSKRPLPLPK